jgi:tripartite-type tricarboxylate transporter receptor subunit TctC
MLALAGAVAAMLSASALAAERSDYPTRPMRMIVPFAPGGASDFVGRIIQPALAEQLGQQVVVDNRAGAGGNIGVEVAARATPDGYNFLLGNVGTMAINPNYYTKFPVRPLRDLIGVTQVVDVPGCFVIHPSLPPKTVKEMVAYLKANPGKLNYGSPAPSSANRLEMEMFLHVTGTKAVQINYKGGAGPAMVGLLGNEVQMMMVTYSSAVNFAKQGRVRMLGVITNQRIPQTPDVPTMREQGFDMVVGSWQGIYVPKGTPNAVIARLFKAAHEAMKNPEVVKRLGDGGVSIVTSSSSAEFRKFWEAENQRFAKVIKEANIETE